MGLWPSAQPAAAAIPSPQAKRSLSDLTPEPYRQGGDDPRLSPDAEGTRFACSANANASSLQRFMLALSTASRSGLTKGLSTATRTALFQRFCLQLATGDDTFWSGARLTAGLR
jgi:hypothetical protein